MADLMPKVSSTSLPLGGAEMSEMMQNTFSQGSLTINSVTVFRH